ncbi:hypothetical protein V2O64_08580 [Verrucomicrobiaceae bacterium 227]
MNGHETVGEGSTPSQEVEPIVELAFKAAFVKLPKAYQERLGDVKLQRAEDFGAGEDAPLDYRLMSRAAFASFHNMSRVMTVYDAGVRNKPSWKGAAPSEDALVVFLGDVADVMGVEIPGDTKAQAFETAWAEFVKRVYSWSEAMVPEPFPSPGDPVVLNRFLEDGVWRAMGGEVPLEQLLFHEFGHALQLDHRDQFQETHMRYWASLSGFSESDSGGASNGYAGGRFKMEEPIVLIRMLLSDDPAGMDRGPRADYAAPAETRFVSRYARYDLREDYAESFRLMCYDPERLAKIAPEKFLYLNALGWNARLDVAEPGPLLYSGTGLATLLPKEGRMDLFQRLLGKDGKGPALHPMGLGAVLRAHAGELTQSDLPEPFPMVPVPDDLPEQLQEGLSLDALKAEIDGVIYIAAPEWQKERQDERIASWVGSYELRKGLHRYRVHGSRGLQEGYESDVKQQRDVRRRASNYEAFREFSRDLLPDDDWKKLDLAEAAFQKKAGNEWAAARFAILASDESLDEKDANLQKVLVNAPAGLDRVRLFGTAVDLAIESRDAEVIEAKIRKIPGETLGAWLRVKYRLRAARILGEEGQGAFRKAARGELEACLYPHLKSELEDLIQAP